MQLARPLNINVILMQIYLQCYDSFCFSIQVIKEILWFSKLVESLGCNRITVCVHASTLCIYTQVSSSGLEHVKATHIQQTFKFGDLIQNTD